MSEQLAINILRDPSYLEKTIPANKKSITVKTAISKLICYKCQVKITL